MNQSYHFRLRCFRNHASELSPNVSYYITRNGYSLVKLTVKCTNITCLIYTITLHYVKLFFCRCRADNIELESLLQPVSRVRRSLLTCCRGGSLLACCAVCVCLVVVTDLRMMCPRFCVQLDTFFSSLFTRLITTSTATFYG